MRANGSGWRSTIPDTETDVDEMGIVQDMGRGIMGGGRNNPVFFQLVHSRITDQIDIETWRPGEQTTM